MIALCLAARPSDSSRIASLVEEVGSARRVIGRDWDTAPLAEDEARRFAAAVTAEHVEAAHAVLQRIDALGATLVTVLDGGYPRNLRRVFDRPAFITIGGALEDVDERSVAIVGTRSATAAGLATARDLAHAIAARGLTVISGLARGIDGAAHEAALEAGGRSIAVVGTGLGTVYPPEHAGLARRIADQGAIVSQFLPDARPARWTFPMRNKTMSGIAVGTIVVEAGATSGARLQAKYALAHRKRLFLIGPLVETEPWARRLRDKPGVICVDTPEQVIAEIDRALETPGMLLLGEPTESQLSLLV